MAKTERPNKSERDIGIYSRSNVASVPTILEPSRFRQELEFAQRQADQLEDGSVGKDRMHNFMAELDRGNLEP